MSREYDRKVVLRCINHDKTLREIYEEVYNEQVEKNENPNANRFDEVAVEFALQTIFHDYIKGDHESTLYEDMQDEAPGKEREYRKREQPDALTNEFQRLLNINGYKRFIAGLMRLSRIKQDHMFNSGLDKQMENWNKIHETLKKLSRMNVTT